MLDAAVEVHDTSSRVPFSMPKSMSLPVPIDSKVPDPSLLARATEIWGRGGLVVFPTETVYGLGAHALDRAAVSKIFAAKGRPAHNPIIVHVATVAQARMLTTDWPDIAERLARRFWPGPLTMVLPRASIVPDEVTGGGPTVALRIPAHPVALALLSWAAMPVAAPSANRSGSLSPTRAEHALGLSDVELILDGGPTTEGLESTVLDLSTPHPRILRPGPLLASDLEGVAGCEIWTRDALETTAAVSGQGMVEAELAPLKSPGLLARHYAPRARLELAAAGLDHGRSRVMAMLADNLRVGWMPNTPGVETIDSPRLLLRRMPTEPSAYGRLLYAILHELDRAEVDCVVVELPEATDERWHAVHDRLRRAAVPMAETQT